MNVFYRLSFPKIMNAKLDKKLWQYILEDPSVKYHSIQHWLKMRSCASVPLVKILATPLHLFRAHMSPVFKDLKQKGVMKLRMDTSTITETNRFCFTF